uniref:Plastid lipid-associated protein/fibrillin conserved domain-containing protein n=1 Tax=Ditylum brightwellii TaxID=49249 RepID=A0A6S8ZJ62_9STRA|mmetsp:Transcript_30374/g.44103  ORF Transcript_30374/g.44103 Transcript_30374/m.44103 type:complete len:264 (+) Transcript_30374:373-1164(+)
MKGPCNFLTMVAAGGVAASILLLDPASAFSAPATISGVSEKAEANFQKYRKALPTDFNIVGAGGWNAVQKLSSDPKAELVSLVVSSLKNSGGQIDTTEGGKVDALLGLLYSRGKGYDSSLVDGDWRLVLSREGQKPPKIQKLVDKKAKVNTAENFFDVDSGIFSGINYTPRGNGKLKSAVKFNPVAENFDMGGDGKVIIRRISCDIVGASFKYWKLPTLPLPLRAKGGYLDFIYMDEDIRITKGNRGGLFVHFRPEFLEQVMN